MTQARDLLAEEAIRELKAGFRNIDVLAEEYERLGHGKAIALELAHRSPGPLRAMSRIREEALAAAAKVAEQRPEDGEECSRAYRHEVGRDIAAAIRSLTPSGDPWKDIGSAPRDGTEILAYSEHGCTGTMLVRHIAPCDFLTDAEAEEWAKQGMTAEDMETADWFAADFLQGERLSPDCYPTHWMPLPPPPASPTASREDENG